MNHGVSVVLICHRKLVNHHSSDKFQLEVCYHRAPGQTKYLLSDFIAAAARSVFLESQSRQSQGLNQTEIRLGADLAACQCHPKHVNLTYWALERLSYSRDPPTTECTQNLGFGCIALLFV